MNYLTKQMAESAISKMANFHGHLKSFYEQHGMDFLEDLGRRNILMSRPQETFFAEIPNELGLGPTEILSTHSQQCRCDNSLVYNWNFFGQTDYT